MIVADARSLIAFGRRPRRCPRRIPVPDPGIAECLIEARLIVADAGPLIAFGRIGKLALLVDVLGDILVPDAVIAECLIESAKPGAAAAIEQALKKRVLPRIDDPDPALPPYPLLDAGESAAIRLALKLSIPVLIDEKAGRKIATNLGLSVIGTVGVLILAKKTATSRPSSRFSTR